MAKRIYLEAQEAGDKAGVEEVETHMEKQKIMEKHISRQSSRRLN